MDERIEKWLHDIRFAIAKRRHKPVDLKLRFQFSIIKCLPSSSY